MVSFFTSSRKRQSNYQGFAKYNNELNSYNQAVAGIPQNGTAEHSVNVSAGSAALAALRIHQAPSPNQPGRSSAAPRTNSLRGNTQRSNSLRTYTYNPKPSYTPGQATIPNARRYSSLTSRSAGPQFQGSVVDAHNNIYNKRVSSLNSQSAVRRPQIHDESESSEGEMVITTQTTRVVDSQGRTQSITTKTIKTLPDGSNIIETTTKNISRSNSRSNSIRNSLLSSARENSYNLSKIDEDLQGFEYNYEIDNPLHTPTPQHFDDFEVLDHDTLHNQTTLKLNTDNYARSGSMSSNKSPQKPLRSILKNTPRNTLEDVPQLKPDSENNETVQLQPAAELEPRQHAYRNISGKPLSEPPKVKVPEVPKGSAQNSGLLGSVLSSPNLKNDEQRSNSSIISPSSHSIQFNDKVETFPVYDSDFKKPKQPISNQELYTKAMEVAMKKVYGTNDVPKEVAPDPIPDSVIQKKDKVDRRISTVQADGITGDYRYENHHKDFATHSLRDDSNLKASSRKERAKEEKRQRKEEEKRRKEEEKRMKEEEKRMKEEEKRMKEEEKLAREEIKKEAKREGKISPLKGIFGRKRNSIDSKQISYPIPLGSSVDSSPLRVQAKTSRASSVLHRVNTPTTGEDVAATAQFHNLSTPVKDFNGVKASSASGVEVTPAQRAAPELSTPHKLESAVGSSVGSARDKDIVNKPSETLEAPVIPEAETEAETEAKAELIGLPPQDDDIPEKVAVATSQVEPGVLGGTTEPSDIKFVPGGPINSTIEVPVLNDVDSDAVDESGAFSEDDTSEVHHSPLKDAFHAGESSPKPEKLPEPAIFKEENIVPEAREVEANKSAGSNSEPDDAVPISTPGQFISTETKQSVTPALTASHKSIKEAENQLHHSVVTPVEDVVTATAEKLQGKNPAKDTSEGQVKPSTAPHSTRDISNTVLDAKTEVDEVNKPIANTVLPDAAANPTKAHPSIVEQNIPTTAHNIDEPSSKSNPPSESSDDRSIQPSHSTVATREEVPVTAAATTTTSEKNAAKPKKVSKFKEKLYKYFVNSYDKQR